MSEYLAHVAVLDDAARLAQRSPTIPEPIQSALRRHTEWARTGAMSRGNHLYTVPLLTAYRDRLDAGPLDEPTLQRLAFVMGWIAHRAADLYVKATHRAEDPEEYYFTPDREGDLTSLPRIWNDLDLYREVYRDGARGLPPGLLSRDLADHPAAGALDVSAAEPVVQARAAAEMATLHAAVADEAAPFGDRLDAFLAARQPLYVRLDRYADRVERPDPEERQRFSTAVRFYDAGDPLLRLAEALREGEAPAVDLGGAVAAAEAEGSQYAQMLALALRWFDAAGRLLTGAAPPEALSETLVIEGGWGGHDHEVRAAGEALHRTILDR